MENPRAVYVCEGAGVAVVHAAEPSADVTAPVNHRFVFIALDTGEVVCVDGHAGDARFVADIEPIAEGFVCPTWLRSPSSRAVFRLDPVRGSVAFVAVTDGLLQICDGRLVVVRTNQIYAPNAPPYGGAYTSFDVYDPSTGARVRSGVFQPKPWTLQWVVQLPTNGSCVAVMQPSLNATFATLTFAPVRFEAIAGDPSGGDSCSALPSTRPRGGLTNAPTDGPVTSVPTKGKKRVRPSSSPSSNPTNGGP